MKFRLLQARLPDDPVREEERLAFATQLGVPAHQVIGLDMLSDVLTHDAVTDGVDAVLVGGSGAFSVLDDTPWMPPFVDVLGSLVEVGFPTFASCFGFQGLVLALGGTIVRDEERSEIGSFELHKLQTAAADPIFADLPDAFVAQLGHKDRADRLPDGVVNLVASERCPYQAFRVGDAPVWATQFHPELTREDNLRRMDRYFHMYATQFGEEEVRQMMDAFRPSPDANALLVRFRRVLEAAEPPQ